LGTNSAYWPESVPTTLWQYTALTPEAQRDFPFVGIEVSWHFVAAFLVGGVLICAFAWKRFAEPSYDVNTDAFRDFKNLNIWSLKDSESLRRAYVIYCILLIFIYAALSFFGRVIFQLASQINVSGLQVSVGSVEFTSWRWPLLLAAGIAGLAPLLNPLIPAENMLRRFAHEVVGIPTRLRGKAIRIRTLIDGAPIVDEKALESIPPWVKRVLGPKLAGYVNLRNNLREVVDWSYKENLQWSDGEIRRKLDEYEKAVRDEAEEALALFESLLKPIERSGDGGDKFPSRKNDEKLLLDTCSALERARDQFSIIMAIYVDFGSAFDSLNGSMKQAITSRFQPDNINPATGFPLYMLAAIFSVYFIFVWIQWHPGVFHHVSLTAPNVAFVAAAETVKVFLLVWLPATTIATLAEVADGRFSHGEANETVAFWRGIAGLLATLGISVGCMMLFAILKTALISRNIEQMTQALLGSEVYSGDLFFYVLLAPVSGICFLGIKIALRYPDQSFKRKRLWIGLIAGIVTLVYLGFVASTSASGSCARHVEGSIEVYDLSLLHMWWTGPKNLEACFSYYSTLDLLVISASVFISIVGLTKAPRRPLENLKAKKQGAAAKAAKTGAEAHVFAIALLASALSIGLVTSARAAEPAKQVGGTVDPTAPTVVLGFRTDIPPFSFQPKKQIDQPQPYLGYVAELCYEIFENSSWQIKQVPITNAESRFELLRGNTIHGPDYQGVEDRDKIDVLCDATTIRLDDIGRINAGIFSPIIFTSGVSYLYRSADQYNDKPVQIGYLGSSTAGRVALEICTADVLRVIKGGGTEGTEPCILGSTSECAGEAQDGSESGGTDGVPAKEPTPSLKDVANLSQTYVLCPMSSHDDLIAWFCQGSHRDKVYVGDLEIIQAKEEVWRAAGKACPGIQPAGKTFTYEPYALLVSKANPELVAFVQRRVYELFSHRGGARALFEKWFPGENMSSTVAWLFLLNGVMDEQDMLQGGKDPPASGPTAMFCATPRSPQFTKVWDERCLDPLSDRHTTKDVPTAGLADSTP